jgi:hypothetical protein
LGDIEDLLIAELKKLPKKPSDTAKQKHKKRYSELMSAAAAVAFAHALRGKGLKETLPLINEPKKLLESHAKENANVNEEEGKEVGGEN